MRLLGNILWFILGGFVMAVSWFAAGILWCLTIIGIPVGIQCFKFAALSLWPFGKEIVYHPSTSSFLLNVIWLVFSGWILALEHFVGGILLAITIIGIPFAKQSFKLARLALMPFGAEIVNRQD
ncbi:MAG TPA: YccF domain-containing protein [Enterococcus aquimarinus]|nr:YccF domain-containing protein [Enterococcus aquimarinus]